MKSLRRSRRSIGVALPTEPPRPPIPEPLGSRVRKALPSTALSLAIALLAGIGSGYVLLENQKQIDDKRASAEQQAAALLSAQAIKLENLRFVRETALGANPARPFGGLDLSGTELASLPLRGAQFEFSNLANTDFLDADLQGARFDEAILYNTDFVDADLRGSNLDPSVPTDQKTHEPTRQEFGQFRGANLSASDIHDARFVKGQIEYADFSHAFLYDVDFSSAILTGVRFAGVCYGKSTRWPTSFTPPPSSPAATCLTMHATFFYAARDEPVPASVQAYDQSFRF
jgi:uncharacterized protein YjbI with pentapeptide repeats